MFVLAMKKLGYLMVLTLVLLSSMVFAEMSISPPKDVYNLGDRLYLDLSGVVGSDSGNLNVDLICNNKTINLVRLPAISFSAEKEQEYSVPYKILNKEDLEISNLTEIVGTCQLVSSIGSHVASTKTFIVSNNIKVTASLDKNKYNPGDSIKVAINAVKDNGDLLNGFVEGSNATSFSKAVENGLATETFSMPKTIEAGKYYLKVYAYDRGRNGILNEGSTTTSFEINQIASSIATSLSNTEITPDDNFSVGTEIFDQSGIKMDGTVSVKIISPNDKEIPLVIKSGGFADVTFLPNSTVGTWKIISSFDSINEQKEIEMLGEPKVNFDFEDSVLTIANIGNMLYNKTINVKIGNKSFPLNLNIKVGETRKFALNAPSGEYKVVAGDGENSITRTIPLSGEVVSIDNVKDDVLKNYSILWVFLILVLAAIGIVFFIRYRKTRTVKLHSGRVSKFKDKIFNAKDKTNKNFNEIKERALEKVPKKVKSHVNNSLVFTNKSPKIQSLDSKNYSSKDKTMVDFTNKGKGVAEYSLVLKGEKYLSSVLTLSIKNYNSTNEISKNALQKIINDNRGKGVVDWRGDYVFIIFSPIMTRTYKNDALAVKTGANILKSLKSYNKKFKDKIIFNIGIHSGELVSSMDSGKLKYTSVGNAVSLSKGISDSDNGKLVISEDVRKKMLRDIKGSRGKDVGNNQTYIVSGVIDRAGDMARLKDLMKRQSNQY